MKYIWILLLAIVVFTNKSEQLSEKEWEKKISNFEKDVETLNSTFARIEETYKHEKYKTFLGIANQFKIPPIYLNSISTHTKLPKNFNETLFELGYLIIYSYLEAQEHYFGIMKDESSFRDEIKLAYSIELSVFNNDAVRRNQKKKQIEAILNDEKKDPKNIESYYFVSRGFLFQTFDNYAHLDEFLKYAKRKQPNFEAKANKISESYEEFKNARNEIEKNRPIDKIEKVNSIEKVYETFQNARMNFLTESVGVVCSSKGCASQNLQLALSSSSLTIKLSFSVLIVSLFYFFMNLL